MSSLVNFRSLTTGGLYVFNGLQGIPSWIYNTRPLPYLLQSHLKILKPFIWNCLFGKESSSLDSEIRNILKFLINSANISYLFLKEVILRWPIITGLGSLKRWFLLLARSWASCLNKFEKPKQDVSFKKGELVMLLRLSLFLSQFKTLKLVIKSLIFFTNIDLP